jgi:hypothetical protein
MNAIRMKIVRPVQNAVSTLVVVDGALNHCMTGMNDKGDEIAIGVVG